MTFHLSDLLGPFSTFSALHKGQKVNTGFTDVYTIDYPFPSLLPHAPDRPHYMAVGEGEENERPKCLYSVEGLMRLGWTYDEASELLNRYSSSQGTVPTLEGWGPLCLPRPPPLNAAWVRTTVVMSPSVAAVASEFLCGSQVYRTHTYSMHPPSKCV